jgi:hypothetical protein
MTPFAHITLADRLNAFATADRRHVEAERNGRMQSDGSQAANAALNHRRGACAELALSKWLGWRWLATVNTFNSIGDLQGKIEVRSKRFERWYMKLRPKTDAHKGDRIFVSLTSMSDDLLLWRVDGWQVGHVVMAQSPVKCFNCWEWQYPITMLESPATLKAEAEYRRNAMHLPIRREYVQAMGGIA